MVCLGSLETLDYFFLVHQLLWYLVLFIVWGWCGINWINASMLDGIRDSSWYYTVGNFYWMNRSVLTDKRYYDPEAMGETKEEG